MSEANRFPILPLEKFSDPEYVLGKLRLGDLVKSGHDIGESISAKHGALWVDKYFGNSEYYCDFLFGVFHRPSAVQDLDNDAKSTEILLGDPDDLVVNLLTITRMEAEPPKAVYFDLNTFRQAFLSSPQSSLFPELH